MKKYVYSTGKFLSVICLVICIVIGFTGCTQTKKQEDVAFNVEKSQLEETREKVISKYKNERNVNRNWEIY